MCNEPNSPELTQAKQNYQEIPVPENIDDYIRRGIAQGKRARRLSNVRNYSLLAACLLLILFGVSVRVSPAIAAYASKIPGLEYIVKLIVYDEGLKLAIDNDFYQPVNRSDQHDGIRFQVDGIIVDESSMVLFYTIETDRKAGETSLDIHEFEFLDEQGNRLKAAYTYGGLLPQGDETPAGVYHETVHIHFSEDLILPDQLTVRVRLSEQPSRDPSLPPIPAGEEIKPPPVKFLPAVWEVSFPIDKAMYAEMKKVYPLNQSLVIKDQTITFKTVTVYPTRIALEVEYDPQNSAQIFGFDDLKFVDEQGREWLPIRHSVSAAMPNENSAILYFQSNYFTTPQKLYLVGSSIRMLPKEDCEVIVDFNQKRLLKGPPGLVLQEISPSDGKGVRIITLAKAVSAENANKSYVSFAHSFKDTQGNEYYMASFGVLSNTILIDREKGEFRQEFLLELPDLPYEHPLVFTIQDYPSRVVQDFRLQVK